MDEVRSERDGDVVTVTIDRPARRNALDLAALDRLSAAVGDAVQARARCLVLTGAGGAFCAGADLGSVQHGDFAGRLRAVLDALAEAPLCALAAIDGPCLGAGVQLAASCDLRVATPASRLGVPAAKLGLVVDHATVARLSRLLGPGQAAAMLLAAEELSGQRAYELGLVQRLGGLDEARSWAGEIAALAPLTIRGHKLALRRVDPALGPDPEVDAAHRAAWGSADVAEGRAAFAERRPPRFQGR